MTRVVAVVLLIIGCTGFASAEVVDAGPTGFSVTTTVEVNAPQASVFRALSEQIARWWDSAHTFSGSAANLTIEARAGSCFCERLPAGTVQHMVVTHVNAPTLLVLQGGLGPLGTMGVAGSLAWTLQERNGRTVLQLNYNVGGYMPGGFVSLAPVVDGVLAIQVKRLKTFAETGRPE